MTFKKRKEYIHYLKTKDIKPYVTWSGEWLSKALGKGYEMIRPRMPQSDNAKYEDWKIIFERYLKTLRKDSIVIGSSLGGILLAKYFSEHKPPKRLHSVYMICAPYDNDLPTEDLGGGFALKKDISRIDRCAKQVYMLFSKKDDVVPVSHAYKFAKKLKKTKIIIFPRIKGHFRIRKFPEIVKMIKRDVKKR